ncbi:MAG: ROK family protein [Alphaproteobacteria bacterium]|nr:ROK family protein [Alphaproteobacteria bacterium]
MAIHVGIDIGGTKMAVAAFTESGQILIEHAEMTPSSYEAFLVTCRNLITRVSSGIADDFTVGVCTAGAIDHEKGCLLSANIPYLNGKRLVSDLERALVRHLRLANDMDCMTLAEAIDGAATGYASVQGITLSTGVGSGLVVHGRIVRGANGLAGEMGHLPLPFREPQDAPLFHCFCGMDDCIEKAICGAGLTRLYQAISGQSAEPPVIAALALDGHVEAVRALDRYYEMVAKAMVTSLHFFDPDVIVLSGGLSRLPHLCREVTQRWGKYCLVKNPKTKLVLAAHGHTAGLRGAAWLWRD